MEALKRSELGSWLGDVSINGDWLVTGGGPKPAMWHLRALAPTVIPDMSGDMSAPVFVTKIISDDRVVLGGQFAKMFHYNFNGDLMAEVKTSSSCLYTVEATEQKDFKILSAAGSNSKIDLCTHNFSYSDNFCIFPNF